MTTPSSAEVPNKGKVCTFLWLHDSNAAAAAAFYVSVIPRTQIISRNAMSVTLSFGATRDSSGGQGHEVILFDGGPRHALTPAVSLVLTCEDQAELDALWEKLSGEGSGGVEVQCGWCEDRFGLCWQVVPRGLDALLGRSKKAWEAMMRMKKLDIAKLEEAAREDERAA